MSRTILLPLETDSETDHANYALDRAVRDGATIHALHVVDTDRYGEPALSSGEVLLDEAEDAGRACLNNFAARCAARGITCETRCCHGRRGEEILRYAQEHDVDVVVLERRLPHAVLTRLEQRVESVVSRPRRRVSAS